MYEEDEECKGFLPLAEDSEVIKLTSTNGPKLSEDANEMDAREIAILGMGNYGRALSSTFLKRGVKIHQGSGRNHHHLSYADAIAGSIVIFLCIPVDAYETTLMNLKENLTGKIIVDVSNKEKETDECNASRLQALLPNSHVVKALNTISAYSLESDAYGASRETYVCSDDLKSKHKVMGVLQQIGLKPVDMGSLLSAQTVESMPFRFFPGWGDALFITIIMLVPILLFDYLRIFWWSPKYDQADLGLYRANRVIAWLMFWLLALTYLPGALAGYIQIALGTKYIRFPNWLDRWMKCRKQLGLICLLLASMHGVMSCILMGGGELYHAVENRKWNIQGKQKNHTIVVFQGINEIDQWSFLFAVLGVGAMGICGIASISSVGEKMSWREWNFVQGRIGFLSLVFGFIHCMLYVHKTWSGVYWKYWSNPKGTYPPGPVVMPMFPLLVIGMKVILLLPGISCWLDKIRKGAVGYRAGRELKRETKVKITEMA